MSTKPTNPNTDRDERVRQIRERHQYNKLWCKQHHMRTPGHSDDIDYLLSLLDSQAAATLSPAPAESVGSMTPDQLEQAALIAESRGIDLETAQELVYLRSRVTPREHEAQK